MKKILTNILILISVSIGFAKELFVPTNYSTIQSALSTAGPGDIITVLPGTYVENLNWPNVANITLRSKAGYKKTIIDGNATGRVLGIPKNAQYAKLIGFTLQNGKLQTTYSDGAGIYVSASNFVMDSCLVTNNNSGSDLVDAWNYGGGANFVGSNFLISNTTFSYNSCSSGNWAYGGGIYIDGVSGEIINSTFYKNSVHGQWSSGAGAYVNGTCTVKMKKCRFERNGSSANKSWCDGSAIYATASFTPGNLYLENCLIRDNYLNGGSFGKKNVIYINEYNLSVMNCTIFNSYNYQPTNEDNFGISYDNFFTTTSSTITNTIIWGANKTSEIENNAPSKNTISITYSDVQGGYSGNGNIKANPIFADSICHLATTSPCLNTGSNINAPSEDLDGYARPYPIGTNVDMGAYEYPTFIVLSLNSESVNIKTNTINIFPNPSSKYATLNFELANNESIKELIIFDSQGKEVLKSTNDNSNFQLNANLQEGLYIVKVIDDNGKSYSSPIVIE